MGLFPVSLLSGYHLTFIVSHNGTNLGHYTERVIVVDMIHMIVGPKFGLV